MRLAKIILLICLIAIIGCNSGITSPNGTKTIHPVVRNNLVEFSINDSEGRELFSCQTNASNTHKWSVYWMSDRHVVLNSSDIGTYIWKEQPDGHWKKWLPSVYWSPDGEHKLDVMDSVAGNLNIDMGRKSSLGGNYIGYTQVPAISREELEGKDTWEVKWLSNERLVLEVKGKPYLYLTLQADGSWQETLAGKNPAAKKGKTK